MGILTNDGSRVLNSVFGGLYPSGALIRRAIVEDAGGSQTVTDTEVPIKVQTDAVTEAMRNAAGYTDTDVRLIVLTGGLTADITTNDKIRDSRGTLWSVTMPALDPCGSHWTIRGQKS